MIEVRIETKIENNLTRTNTLFYKDYSFVLNNTDIGTLKYYIKQPKELMLNWRNIDNEFDYLKWFDIKLFKFNPDKNEVIYKESYKQYKEVFKDLLLEIMAKNIKLIEVIL